MSSDAETHDPLARHYIKVGRPSKYKPELCNTAIAMGAKGKSPVQIAAHFGVSRQTLNDWAAAHPEFSEALELSRTLAQACLENVGEEGLHKPGFNANHWKTIMANRYREDYTERKEQIVTGPNGGPLQVANYTKIDVRILTPEDRDALEQILLLAGPEGSDDAR